VEFGPVQVLVVLAIFAVGIAGFVWADRGGRPRDRD
jgi:hypothetical protein